MAPECLPSLGCLSPAANATAMQTRVCVPAEPSEACQTTCLLRLSVWPRKGRVLTSLTAEAQQIRKVSSHTIMVCAVTFRAAVVLTASTCCALQSAHRPLLPSTIHNACSEQRELASPWSLGQLCTPCATPQATQQPPAAELQARLGPGYLCGTSEGARRGARTSHWEHAGASAPEPGRAGRHGGCCSGRGR